MPPRSGSTPAVEYVAPGQAAHPPRYHPALLVWTQTAVDQAARLNAKEVAAQPTEALQRTTQATLAALWNHWKQEVLHNAGTFQKALQYEYQGLGAWIMKDVHTAADYDAIATVLESLQGKVCLLRDLAQAQARPQEKLGEEDE